MPTDLSPRRRRHNGFATRRLDQQHDRPEEWAGVVVRCNPRGSFKRGAVSICRTRRQSQRESDGRLRVVGGPARFTRRGSKDYMGVATICHAAGMLIARQRLLAPIRGTAGARHGGVGVPEAEMQVQVAMPIVRMTVGETQPMRADREYQPHEQSMNHALCDPHIRSHRQDGRDEARPEVRRIVAQPASVNKILPDVYGACSAGREQVPRDRSRATWPVGPSGTRSTLWHGG